jgi:hypothetical protein
VNIAIAAIRLLFDVAPFEATFANTIILSYPRDHFKTWVLTWQLSSLYVMILALFLLVGLVLVSLLNCILLFDMSNIRRLSSGKAF